MRSTTKSKLTSSLAERVLERRMRICDTKVYYVSALLWSIPWPQEGSHLKIFIQAFESFVISALESSNVILVFDRYFDDSVKACHGLLRQETDGRSRPYSVKPEMLIPPRSSVLKVTQNKKQLNCLLAEALLHPAFYTLATQNGHTLNNCRCRKLPN